MNFSCSFLIIFFSSSLAVGVLTYFIPNIHEKTEIEDEIEENKPRLSVTSFEKDAIDEESSDK